MFSTLKIIVFFIVFTCQISSALESFSISEMNNVQAINSIMTEEWSENIKILTPNQNSASNNTTNNASDISNSSTIDVPNGAKLELLLKKKIVILN